MSPAAYAAPSLAPDFAALKGRQQKTWASGDFSVVASRIVFQAEHLCETADIQAGWRVLDVATGSGNAAIAAARRGCEVVGIDFVPALLQRGRIRAAAELARVCRPGGRIALASWTPDGFIGETFRIFARHLPPAPGLQPPIRWGDQGYLDSLFGHVAASVTSHRRTAVFRFRSAEENVDFFSTYYGPTLRAFESLDPPQRESLRDDLIALARRYDRNGGTGPIAITADYLETVVVRE